MLIKIVRKLEKLNKSFVNNKCGISLKKKYIYTHMHNFIFYIRLAVWPDRFGAASCCCCMLLHDAASCFSMQLMHAATACCCMLHKTGQDRTRQGKTGQDMTRQDKTGQEPKKY